MVAGRIYAGVGGWSYEPWRGPFYPPGLPQAREFDYAVTHLTAIEINATFYGRQKPESFARWAAAAPDGFKFAVKGSRYCVTRPKLADAGEGIQRFLDQGLDRLEDRLGPILWQFSGNRKFDRDDIAAFLKLLPAKHGALDLCHVIEARHESFRDPAFADLARDANAAIVYADADDYPCFNEATADFRYARLQRCREEIVTGYDAAGMTRWTDLARGWSAGGDDVFMFFISGAKIRAPAAAQALIAKLG